MLTTLRTFIERVDDTVALAVSVVVFALAVVAASHAVLTKRDVRAAIAWTGLILLVPLVGTLLYVTLGINRIERRARALLGPRARAELAARMDDDEALSALVPSALAPLVRLTGGIAHRPLTRGNGIAFLESGDAAYPPMLAAIDAAERSVALSSYIFANDEIGHRFVDALARAHARGVVVRVLIDAVGARYSPVPITGTLAKRGVPVARFLPLSLFHWPFLNMRSHRKILVVDGRLAFVGGINIRDNNLARAGAKAIVDLHARVTGPVVGELLRTFAEDWRFTTREELTGEAWSTTPAHEEGSALARVVADGPGIDFDVLRTTLMGALSVAKERVAIVTPYFVPDSVLIAALAVCARRGVTVDIVIPARSNLPFVDWATRALLWQVLEPGCRVWLTPAPFDHTKLMVIDGAWTFFGSANWDARSLRLNFEVNVECYDDETATRALALVDARIARARQTTLDEVDGRALPVRLVHGLARLLSPYL